MKTISKSAYVFALSCTLALGSACKKETQEITTEEQYISEDTTIVDTTASVSVDQKHIESANNATSGSKTTMNSNTASTASKKNSGGYSAPDGTDAENHDGDQYTKNNPKPMPTGTTIQ